MLRDIEGLSQKPTVKNPKIIPFQSPHLDAYLDKLFCQPYWRRVWVIRELTVYSNVTIIFGSCYLSWADISTVLDLLNQPGTDAAYDSRRGSIYPDALHLLQFRTDFLLERKPISLLDALVWSEIALATDPRDKIFALLGLCHDGATFVPVPNYKQPLQTVIVEMVSKVSCFRQGQTFGAEPFNTRFESRSVYAFGVIGLRPYLLSKIHSSS